jgi:hypothetical protein
MLRRFLETPGRIIVSKAGFAADPSMPDDQKLFDSNWDWSGVLLEAGSVTDPAPNQAGGGTLTTKGYPPLVIPFKRDYGYRPAVIARWNAPPTGNFWDSIPWSGFDVKSPMVQQGSAGALPTITTNSIIITREISSNPNYDARYPGTIDYEVYGVD